MAWTLSLVHANTMRESPRFATTPWKVVEMWSSLTGMDIGWLIALKDGPGVFIFGESAVVEEPGTEVTRSDNNFSISLDTEPVSRR